MAYCAVLRCAGSDLYYRTYIRTCRDLTLSITKKHELLILDHADPIRDVLIDHAGNCVHMYTSMYEWMIHHADALRSMGGISPERSTINNYSGVYSSINRLLQQP